MKQFCLSASTVLGKIPRLKGGIAKQSTRNVAGWFEVIEEHWMGWTHNFMCEGNPAHLLQCTELEAVFLPSNWCQNTSKSENQLRGRKEIWNSTFFHLPLTTLEELNLWTLRCAPSQEGHIHNPLTLESSSKPQFIFKCFNNRRLK